MMQICVYTYAVNFREFLNRKYLEWRANKIGAAGSISSWGREMGVSPQVLNGWMNRGSVPRAESIAKLTNYLGPEVYGVLGLDDIDDLSLGGALLAKGIPPEWVDNLEAALDEAQRQATVKGVEIDSPEGISITRSALLEFGLTVRDNK